jgi:hypothetical protein
MMHCVSKYICSFFSIFWANSNMSGSFQIMNLTTKLVGPCSSIFSCFICLCSQFSKMSVLNVAMLRFSADVKYVITHWKRRCTLNIFMYNYSFAVMIIMESFLELWCKCCSQCLKFKNTKGVPQKRKSGKDTQYNGQ